MVKSVTVNVDLPLSLSLSLSRLTPDQSPEFSVRQKAHNQQDTAKENNKDQTNKRCETAAQVVPAAKSGTLSKGQGGLAFAASLPHSEAEQIQWTSLMQAILWYLSVFFFLYRDGRAEGE